MTGEQRQKLERAIAGDKDALAALLAAFGPEVEVGLTISPTWRGLLDAADVMQVTYLEAFLQIRSFDADRADSFGGWLRQIAQNNLRDAIRGLESQKNPPPRKQLNAYAPDAGLGLLDLLTAGVGTPSLAARRGEVEARVRQALSCLPPDYARTLQLYDLEARHIDDVARELGRTPGAVFMLRMRALERLRGLLGSPSQILESRA